MRQTIRRRASRALVLGVPFVLLFLGVRVLAPLWSSTTTRKLVGKGYESVLVAGDTAPFEVFNHGSHAEDDAALVAARLDGFIQKLWKHVDLELAMPRPDPKQPIRLLLFETRSDLERFVEIDQGRDFTHNAGYYSPVRQEIALVRDRDGAVPAPVLRHEAAHLVFSSGQMKPMSPWLAEGLATLYEHDGPDGSPEAPDADLLSLARTELLTGRQKVDLDAILAGDRERFSAADNASAYAWAAALTAFLMDRRAPERRKAFLGIVRSEREGGPLGLDAVLRRLGADEHGLEREFSRWLRSR